MSNRKVPDSVAALTKEFVAQITDLYKDRLHQVILFGSYARGEQRADSDVDYLVVLNDEDIRTFSEISLISPITGSLGLKYDKWISAVPIVKSKFEGTLLYYNIQKDGIIL